MRKLTFLFLLISTLLLAIPAKAQTYTTGIGLRLGPWYGFTIKHHIGGDDTAIEGIIHVNFRHTLMVIGLYEKHFPAFGEAGLRWYLGGGAHVGFWSSRYYWNNGNGPRGFWFDDYNESGVILGLDAIGGIEYTVPDIPLNISLDLKPSLNFVPGIFPFYNDGAVSVRYTF